MKLIFWLVPVLYVASCNNDVETRIVESKDTFNIIKNSNGSILIKSQIFGGKKNGKHRGYYINGQLKEAGYFVDDKKEGIWRTYDSSNELTNVYIYSHDSLKFTLDKDDFTFYKKTIHGDNSIFVPQFWKLAADSLNYGALLVARKDCQNDFCPTYSLLREVDSMSKSDYIVKVFAMLKEKHPDATTALYFDKSTGDQPFTWYDIQFKQHGIDLTTAAVFMLKNNSIYILYFTSKTNEYEKQRYLIRDLIASFK